MSTSEVPEPTAEVARQLELANSQLALYARDLKRLLERERDKAWDLTAAYQQLQAYAKDLKTAFDAERRKSRELAEANARLQILDRLKTDFLTFVSHELRTPLTGISAVDIFDPHGDPTTQDKVIGLIRRSYERLNRFVEKGLEYFRWLTERAETLETTDLALVVRQVADNTLGLAQPGVNFQVCFPSVPCLVRGEKKHLAKVVETLLDNALKFSRQEKSIRADLRLIAGKAILAIADRGQGFAPELAQELLRPFTIADVMHHSQGTGLSLALASAIVEAYSGQIRAESEGVGKGATFTVEFPALSLPQKDIEKLLGHPSTGSG